MCVRAYDIHDIMIIYIYREREGEGEGERWSIQGTAHSAQITSVYVCLCIYMLYSFWHEEHICHNAD